MLSSERAIAFTQVPNNLIYLTFNNFSIMNKIYAVLTALLLNSFFAMGQINIAADKSIGINILPTPTMGTLLYRESNAINGISTNVGFQTRLKYVSSIPGNITGIETKIEDQATGSNSSVGYTGINNDYSSFNALPSNSITCIYNRWIKPSTAISSWNGIINSLVVGGNASNFGISQIIKNECPSTAAVQYGYYGNVFSLSSNSAQSVGIYSTVSNLNPANLAAQFQGNITVSGTVTSGSDKNLKKNIKDIGKASEILKQILPKEYNLIEETTDKKHYGVIAQDIELILPELVGEFSKPNIVIKDVVEKVTKSKVEKDKDGNNIVKYYTEDVTSTVQNIESYTKYKSVNYIELIPLLIQTVKEQQATIEQLQADVIWLKTKVK